MVRRIMAAPLTLVLLAQPVSTLKIRLNVFGKKEGAQTQLKSLNPGLVAASAQPAMPAPLPAPTRLRLVVGEDRQRMLVQDSRLR